MGHQKYEGRNAAEEEPSPVGEGSQLVQQLGGCSLPAFGCGQGTAGLWG